MHIGIPLSFLISIRKNKKIDLPGKKKKSNNAAAASQRGQKAACVALACPDRPPVSYFSSDVFLFPFFGRHPRARRRISRLGENANWPNFTGNEELVTGT